MPNPGTWVMPRNTSVAVDPAWKACGLGIAGTTFPRLAEVVNCTSAQVLVKVGGSELGTGQDPGAAAGMVVAAKGLWTAAVLRSTRTGRKRLALTTAWGPLTASS